MTEVHTGSQDSDKYKWLRAQMKEKDFKNLCAAGIGQFGDDVLVKDEKRQTTTVAHGDIVTRILNIWVHNNPKMVAKGEERFAEIAAEAEKIRLADARKKKVQSVKFMQSNGLPEDVIRAAMDSYGLTPADLK
jgi:hypothetical protein